MDKWWKTDNPELHFNYKRGDVVWLADNRLAIIVHRGIYSDQYWCQVYYPDGVHLGAADYFTAAPDGYDPRIVKKADEKNKEIAIKALSKAVTDYQKWEKEVCEKLPMALWPPETYGVRFDLDELIN